MFTPALMSALFDEFTKIADWSPEESELFRSYARRQNELDQLAAKAPSQEISDEMRRNSQRLLHLRAKKRDPNYQIPSWVHDPKGIPFEEVEDARWSAENAAKVRPEVKNVAKPSAASVASAAAQPAAHSAPVAAKVEQAAAHAAPAAAKVEQAAGRSLMKYAPHALGGAALIGGGALMAHHLMNRDRR